MDVKGGYQRGLLAHLQPMASLLLHILRLYNSHPVLHIAFHITRFSRLTVVETKEGREEEAI